MEVEYSFIYFVSAGLKFFTMLVLAYYFVISIFGIIEKFTYDNIIKHKPQKTFAFVIPAHNEEIVIGHIVENLKSLNYPSELYDIFVIADNCSDRTAEIAREKGALVYERFNKVERGKGFALKWMFDIILNKLDKKYDAVVVLDADNLVSKNFLIEMNEKLCRGEKVIQGYIDSKNPYDSWITASYSIAFWTANRLFQSARYHLGLSCELGGTGFCIDTEVLREIGWDALSLTEDLEFTMKLAQKNIKVTWADDAIVYDEKPLTLLQSWRQRKRWMQGFADVAVRYSGTLIKKSIRDKDLVAFDCALYALQPFITIIIGISMLFDFIKIFYPEMFFDINTSIIAFEWQLFLLLQTFYILFALFVDNKIKNIKILLYYLILYPIYCLTWIPITIHGIIDMKKKEWSHTLHTRGLSISDIE